MYHQSHPLTHRASWPWTDTSYFVAVCRRCKRLCWPNTVFVRQHRSNSTNEALTRLKHAFKAICTRQSSNGTCPMGQIDTESVRLRAPPPPPPRSDQYLARSSRRAETLLTRMLRACVVIIVTRRIREGTKTTNRNRFSRAETNSVESNRAYWITVAQLCFPIPSLISECNTSSQSCLFKYSYQTCIIHSKRNTISHGRTSFSFFRASERKWRMSFFRSLSLSFLHCVLRLSIR